MSQDQRASAYRLPLSTLRSYLYVFADDDKFEILQFFSSKKGKHY